MRRGFLLAGTKPPPPPPPSQPPLPPPTQPSPSPPPPPLPPLPTQSSAPDRLSSLEDAILINIISLLCIDEMVRTGILSRRWIRLWTRSPILHFTRNFSSLSSADVDHYPSITDLCLSHCSSNPEVISARFPLARDPTSTADADRWIRFSAVRSVERLAFAPIFFGPHRVPMPRSLFACRTLTELRLNACSISFAAPVACFPSLRTIVLTAVLILDAPMEALLESAPNLESLSLSKVRGVTRLIVAAPNLRHLMVYDCGDLRRVEVVEAPLLRRLMYSGEVSKIANLEGKVPLLEEVAMLSTERAPFKNPDGWKCLVGALAHARVLTVSSWFYKFTLKDFGPRDEDAVFKNLKELHWWPVYQKFPGARAEPWSADKISTNSLDALLSVLRDCPSLELLCIRATFNMEHEDDMSRFSYRRCSTERLPPLSADSVAYELPCLKTVNITEFSGSKAEMRLVKFLAEKGAALDSVTLHYVEDIEAELEGIRNELTSIHTASPRARISFSEFDEDKVCPKHEDMWYDYMIM